ncbi:MAG TPA: S1-like domain-containing RNA-binding protein [Polyangiaceae bacterium]|nr:S1-like domain-containing RNA-binding protein [Polyangiaceae bacterium]
MKELLGRTTKLRVARFSAPGVYLATDDAEILLPNAEVPRDLKEGDELEAFVHLDSEDRPIATLRAPAVKLGEVAFLEVKDLAPFGAFVEWGLVKQLLVPMAEQIRDIHVGERHPVGLVIDRSGRLAGTMRVSEMLRAKPSAKLGDWVDGEAWRNDPEIGVFVIVEKTYVGLLPKTEPHALRRGARAKFRVVHVHEDGKIELSLRGAAHDERDADGKKILDVFAREPSLRVSDDSTPEEIRARFGLSKKAFKRAAGGLLKRGAIELHDGAFKVKSKS